MTHALLLSLFVTLGTGGASEELSTTPQLAALSPQRAQKPFRVGFLLNGILPGVELGMNFGPHVALDIHLTTLMLVHSVDFGTKIYFIDAGFSPVVEARVGGVWVIGSDGEEKHSPEYGFVGAGFEALFDTSGYISLTGGGMIYFDGRVWPWGTLAVGWRL